MSMLPKDIASDIFQQLRRRLGVFNESSIIDDLILSYIFICLYQPVFNTPDLSEEDSQEGLFDDESFIKDSFDYFKIYEKSDKCLGIFDYLNRDRLYQEIGRREDIGVYDYIDHINNIISKYSEAPDKLFRILLESYSENHSSWQNGYYTPDCIVQLISRVAKREGVARLLDYSVSTGEIIQGYLEKGFSSGIEVRGYDTDAKSVCFSRMAMMLNDSVSDYLIEQKDIIEESGKYDGPRFDLIISNPPFGRRDKLEAISGNVTPWGKIPDNSVELMYLYRAYERLGSDGQAVLVVSQGVLSRGGKVRAVRERISRIGFVKAIINLPQKIFYGTNVAVSLLVIDKGKTDTSIRFIDAEGYMASKNSSLNEEVVSWVCDSISDCGARSFCKLVTLEAMNDSDYEWSSKRYINAQILPGNETIEDLKTEIFSINQKIKSIDNKLLKYEPAGCGGEA